MPLVIERIARYGIGVLFWQVLCGIILYGFVTNIIDSMYQKSDYYLIQIWSNSNNVSSLYNSSLLSNSSSIYNPFSSLYVNNYFEYVVKRPSFANVMDNNNNNVKLMIFICANYFNSKGRDVLLINSIINNHSINIMGLNQTISSTKMSHWLKLPTTYNQLSYLINDDNDNNNNYDDIIILFVDAFDVIIQLSPKDILNKFFEIEQNLDNKNVVIYSTEFNCYPHLKFCKDSIYPKVPFSSQHNVTYYYRKKGKKHRKYINDTTARYLNSGGWIGRLSNVYKLYSKMIDIGIHNDHYNLYKCNHSKYGDQCIQHAMFVYHDMIRLDYNQSIFASMNRKSTSQIRKEWKLFDKYGVNKNNYPATIHFNGNTGNPKAKLTKLIKEMRNINKLKSKHINKLKFNTNLGFLDMNQIKKIDKY